MDNSSSSGCKRCNCKKSRCLKLYCECFADGMYCDESCSCQECINQEVYEDTVQLAREQIQSRNPIAFHSKIQQANEDTGNSSEDGGPHFTPSSARHKRGCHCKKSKCSKKYCECYQAHVGCSEGCQCEGCENVYGRQGENAGMKDVVIKQVSNEVPVGSSGEKLKRTDEPEFLLHNDPSFPHNLAPMPHFLQPSGYRAAHDPEPTMLTPFEMLAGSSFHANNRGINNEMLSSIPFGMHSDPGRVLIDQFSPINEFGNVNLPAMPSSGNWLDSTNAQIISESSQVPTARSLDWLSSHLDPMTHFQGDKFLGVDDDVYSMANISIPKIVTESHTPPDAVNMVSPTEKRVSIPCTYETMLSPNSSGGVTTSQKYTLQAGTSFTPRTPSVGSKSVDHQTKNDSQL